MARFRGTIQGNRQEASRLGSISSGLEGVLNGWEMGVSVQLYVDSQGRDRANIWLTPGSAGRGRDKLLARIVLHEGRPVVTDINPNNDVECVKVNQEA